LVRYIKEVFRSTLRDLLGPSGLNALERYLNRKLQDDMYEVFVDSPSTFYNVLRSFLGKGADAILRIAAKKLIDEGKIEGLSAEEFIELMKSNDEESYRRFLNSFGR
jgi:vacuolar-type H+-ATPase subunit C/Vma6